MKRSSVVKVALPGDLGKPRPALVVQSDAYDATGTVAVLPLTSDLTDITLFRVLLEPSPDNGLRRPSHVMIDKITNVRRDKVGGVIGTLRDDVMLEITRKLAVFLGVG
jgi:mRNA interferase MazF